MSVPTEPGFYRYFDRNLMVWRIAQVWVDSDGERFVGVIGGGCPVGEFGYQFGARVDMPGDAPGVPSSGSSGGDGLRALSRAESAREAAVRCWQEDNAVSACWHLSRAIGSILTHLDLDRHEKTAEE